ncbi:enoyl-CoA hydratase/isomerase family protein [Nocardioides sp. Bht2]|uniref:enoyl-CoA hydratase/isomerase family protein n=1 Tax=Nocardioides sp. Bht2 TaxID=3392297 RepID=UPI0039B515A0
MSVLIDRRDGVVEITLNRPQKRNAMTDEMWAQMEEHLASIDPAAGDRVLVITGAGEAFCGGSDVDGLLDDLPSLPDRIDVSNRCVLGVRALPIPTLAKVDGIAAGSALNMALACDLVFASDRARFAQLFVHIGLSLDSGASWLLPRLVGERKARELSLLGEQVSATDALAIGMISKVVPHTELADTVTQVAIRLAGFNPAALAGTKKMLNRAWEIELAEALRAETENQVEVIQTDRARELIGRFTRR